MVAVISLLDKSGEETAADAGGCRRRSCIGGGNNDGHVLHTFAHSSSTMRILDWGAKMFRGPPTSACVDVSFCSDTRTLLLSAQEGFMKMVVLASLPC